MLNINRHKIIALFIITLFCLSCNHKKKGNVIDSNAYIPLPKTVLSPKENPTSPEKTALGKLLFYDPILSGNRDVACASCHHPEFGYAEFVDISIGVNGEGLGNNRRFKKPNDIPFVKRNAHTILNTAFNGINAAGNYSPEKAPMFWDLRVQSLEDQALAPIKSFEEMRGHSIAEKDILDSVVNRLQNIPEYVAYFKKAFGTSNAISSTNLAKAIAAFERTLVTNNSRFDQYIAGDSTALSLSEKEGFKLFKKAKCTSCHLGPMFSDFKVHTLGVPDNEKLPVSDDGFEKKYGFRTPTLRNLRYTAPYMHTGKFKNLQEVLEFYEDISSGVAKNQHVSYQQIDPLIKKVNIKVIDMKPIIYFFNSLNDEHFDKTVPEKVPSKLPVGGNIYSH
ncbi:cytochrome-c peroxidase [Polaribacter staleyi]|uniref:cytochrome-c peroxidase n=1 Tax=Polaribacter staleyi TaxID=2022337 RepID=UPI0031BB9C3A